MPAIPKGAKRPADHKSAAKAEATDGVILAEHNGVTYTIDSDVFSDAEFLEMIGDMQDGDALLLPRVVRSALGDEQWAAFKDANRNEKGRVPVESLSELFSAMDAASGNSEASSGS